MDIHKGASKLF